MIHPRIFGSKPDLLGYFPYACKKGCGSTKHTVGNSVIVYLMESSFFFMGCNLHTVVSLIFRSSLLFSCLLSSILC